jgi:uncharacterized membrane protein (DUF4010 family)
VADSTELEAVVRLAIATLVGLAVGAEREWSGHASGPNAHFAGIRTFLLLGVIGGGAGILASHDQTIVAAILLAVSALLVIAAYVASVRRPESDLDGTTETAAIVVLMLGTLAGLGSNRLAAGAGAIVVLVLGEKARLHALVRHIGEREMQAALRFSVMALVVLPLLPEGPVDSLGGVHPRALWTLVLLFSGINFAGYVARRAVGAERGYGITGLLGGVVSSTAVTLQFARASRHNAQSAPGLALGVVAACAVLPVRVAVVSALLDVNVARALVPYLLPPALAGALMVVVALRRQSEVGARESRGEGSEAQSPLGLRSAITMALLFQAAMFVLEFVQRRWGTGGVVATGSLLGLTDMDALTVSMNRLASGAGAPAGAALAALGIGVGHLSNTLFKLALGVVVGSGRFRRLVAMGLGVLALTSGAGIWLASQL